MTAKPGRSTHHFLFKDHLLGHADVMPVTALLCYLLVFLGFLLLEPLLLLLLNLQPPFLLRISAGLAQSTQQTPE